MKKTSTTLHPITVQGEVWHQIGMDFIGPLKETPRGNKYIMTVTDYFSNGQRLSSSLTNQQHPVSNIGKVNVDLFVERMVKVHDELKDKASANITEAQTKQKEYYDSRHSHTHVCTYYIEG